MTDLVLRHFKIVAFLIAALTAASVGGIVKLRSSFFRAIPLPESDPAVLANAALGDRFGGFESVTFVLEADDVLSPTALAALRGLTEDAKNLSGVHTPQAVASLATAVLPGSGSQTLSFKPLLEGSRAEIDARIRDTPYIDGLLVNRQRTAALVIASIGERAYPDPSVASDEFQATHFAEVRALTRHYSQGGIRVSATGSVLALFVTRTKVLREMGAIGGIALALLLLVLMVSFKSWRLTWLAFAMMLLTSLWTFGLMGWFDIPIGQCSVYVLIVILAVGSSYAIHVIATVGSRALQVRSKRIAVRMAITDVSLPLLTVSLAASLSGISLLSFDIPDIRELGVLQALGIAISYALSYFLLPALVVRFGSGALRERERRQDRPQPVIDTWIQRLLDGLIRMPLARPGLSLAIVTGVIALSAVGIDRVIPGFVLEESMPRFSLPRVGYERISRQLGAFRLATVVFERTDEGKVLEPAPLKTLHGIQTGLARIEGVRVLPSIADVLETLGRGALGHTGIPERQDEIDQLLLVAGRSKLSRLIDRTGRHAAFSIALDASDPRRMDEVILKVQDALKRVPAGYFSQLSGTPVLVASINRYIIENKLLSIALCLAIVLILCVMVNASLSLGLISMASAAVAALAVFGFMGFARIYLDMSSATITTIAIGVGVDSAVHYLLQFRSDLLLLMNQPGRSPPREDALRPLYREAVQVTTRRYGKTIVFDALSNILGFVPLLFSSFPVLEIAGLLLVLNQILVLLATFFVTPTLILILRPDLPKGYRRATESDELADELA